MPKKSGAVKSGRVSIKKGDQVRIIAGKDKGVEGKVIEVVTDADRVIVEGVNRIKRHIKAGQTSGSLTFHNSQRLTNPNATTFQRTATDTRPLVQLELRGATGPADALYAYAQAGATPAFDGQFDAEKMANSTGLNLSSNISFSP